MKRPAPLAIFVLIDALGWRYAAERGFLDSMLGYRTRLRTVLGFSSAAIPTLLTGVAPARHGHWNLLYRDPAGSPFRRLRPLRYLPEAAVNNRYARRGLTEIGRRVLGLGRGFECSVSPRALGWFNWTEKRDIYAPGGIAGAKSYFDRLAESGISHRVYTYRRASDAEILRQAACDVSARRAGVFFLYLSELDLLLHNHARDPGVWGAALGRYEAGLESLFHLAIERDSDAALAVFSDHGMTPVRAQIPLAGEIRKLGLRTPDDYLAVYDSTMARFWFSSERARREVAERLATMPGGRVLEKSELERLGVYFPDGRHGDLIFLLDPGHLLADGNFHASGWKPAGMHGYHPDDPDSDGVFLSNCAPSAPIRELADVHAFLCDVSFGVVPHEMREAS
jgi:predicted AlkP superfamily pyrophosphatase or phosphodiesterase